MVDCSDCGSSMVRMYDKDYINVEYPVYSPKDLVNIKMQIEMRRFFKCECGFSKRLNDKEYFDYVLKAKGLRK